METALVLGAGGTVGMAYHAGVLRALDEAGLAPGDSDLIIGTSAGSVMGSMLRLGWTAEDIWLTSQGEHPLQDAALAVEATEHDAREGLFTPGWRTPLGFFRRAIGSSWVLTRSMIRWPPVRIPPAIRSFYRGGMMSGSQTREGLAALFPEAWPDRDLYLCTVDLTSGRRVTLGRPGSPSISWPLAVQASCSVPGLWPPVRLGERILVDGGAHSTTNLDLAPKAGCSRIVAVVPMAYEPGDPPGPRQRLIRRFALEAVVREARFAKRRGAEVLLVRPSSADIERHGVDMLRPEGNEAVAHSAYESTLRLLETDHARPFLAA